MAPVSPIGCCLPDISATLSFETNCPPKYQVGVGYSIREFITMIVLHPEKSFESSTVVEPELINSRKSYSFGPTLLAVWHTSSNLPTTVQCNKPRKMTI